MISKNKIYDEIFRISILIKFIDGILEVIGSFVLFFVSMNTLNLFIRALFGSELLEDPKDFLAGYLIHLASNMSVSSQIFLALYLLIHGLIKMGLVIALWTKRLWAYPVAGILLIFFTLYQIYLFMHTYSILQFFLTITDIVILLLLRFEYNKIRRQHTK
jgi:uncharacterized membrane protein